MVLRLPMMEAVLARWDWLVFFAALAIVVFALRGRIRRAIAARAVAPPFDPEAVLRRPRSQATGGQSDPQVKPPSAAK